MSSVKHSTDKQIRKAKLQQIRNDYLASKIQSHWRGKIVRKRMSEKRESEPYLKVEDVKEGGEVINGSLFCEKIEQAKSINPVGEPENVTPESKDTNIPSEVANEININPAQSSILESRGNFESIWPEPICDNYDYIGDTELPWPDLSVHDKEKIVDWMIDKQRILLRAITWNMQAAPPPPIDDVRKNLLPLNRFHIIAIGTEECERTIAQSAINPSKKNWESYLNDAVGDMYKPIRSQTLQAIHMIVFVHLSIEHLVSDIKASAVACGVGNTMGNKGGVGVSFKLGHSRIVLVGCHLQAHEHEHETRNSQFHKIYNELFSQFVKGNETANNISSSNPSANNRINPNPANENPETIANDIAYTTDDANNKVTQASTLDEYADILIFMGDFNYRINGNTSIVRKLLEKNMYDVLISNDQLGISIKNRDIPVCFQEAKVLFRPTYKFISGTNEYDAKKNRIPSWTDRILYSSKGVTPLSYNADMELRISDHRPVFASFLCNVNVDVVHKSSTTTHTFVSESQVCTIM